MSFSSFFPTVGWSTSMILGPLGLGISESLSPQQSLPSLSHLESALLHFPRSGSSGNLRAEGGGKSHSAFCPGNSWPIILEMGTLQNPVSISWNDRGFWELMENHHFSWEKLLFAHLFLPLSFGKKGHDTIEFCIKTRVSSLGPGALWRR